VVACQCLAPLFLLQLIGGLELLGDDVEINWVSWRLRLVGILIGEQTLQLFLGLALYFGYTLLACLGLGHVRSSVSFGRSTTRDLAPIMFFPTLNMLLVEFLRANQTSCLDIRAVYRT